MVTEQDATELAETVEKLKAPLSGDLEMADKDSSMVQEYVLTGVGMETLMKNPFSIHFEPRNSSECWAFSNLVKKELTLQEFDATNLLLSLTEREQLLLDLLMAKAHLFKFLIMVQHCQCNESAQFLLLQAIPCILHLENHIGLKILTIGLLEGVSNAAKGNTFINTSTDGQGIKAFFTSVESIVNTKMLGDDANPTQWVCPRDKSGNSVGTITMENTHARSIINSFDFILHVCVPGSDANKDKWSALIDFYRSAIKKLWSKEDFMDVMIDDLQRDIDLFFQKLVKLATLSGVTNYIHLLSLGHVAAYLKHWKNLYCHSQGVGIFQFNGQDILFPAYAERRLCQLRSVPQDKTHTNGSMVVKT
jgi:hypothetical protein